MNRTLNRIKIAARTCGESSRYEALTGCRIEVGASGVAQVVGTNGRELAVVEVLGIPPALDGKVFGLKAWKGSFETVTFEATAKGVALQAKAKAKGKPPKRLELQAIEGRYPPWQGVLPDPGKAKWTKQIDPAAWVKCWEMWQRDCANHFRLDLENGNATPKPFDLPELGDVAADSPLTLDLSRLMGHLKLLRGSAEFRYWGPMNAIEISSEGCRYVLMPCAQE